MRKIYRGELRYYIKSYPTTTVLMTLTAVGFILNLMGISHSFVFLGLESLSRPWTILTHPFAFISPPGFAFLSMLFATVTLWFTGRALESRWSTWGLAFFFILVTLAASAWSVVIGLLGFGLVSLYEPWIVLGGAIILWAWENPELPLLAYGLFPVKAIYLAWIYVAFYFFLLFPGGLFTACTALIPVGVAWLWERAAKRRGRGEVRKRESKNRSYLRRIK